MPIPRRISQSALSAIQPGSAVNDRSGTYPIPLPEEEDEFAHIGELPSLMPPRNSPALRLVEEKPQSYRSVEMPAVAAPRSSYADTSSMFGDEEDQHTESLVLDLQVKPTNHVNVAPQAMAPAPPSAPTPVHVAAKPTPPTGIPLGGMSGTYLAAAAPGDPKPGIVAFAGYGIPPTKLSQMPGYAFRVMARRATLRSDLKIARLRRLPQREVELYEAALRCADESTVTKGIAVVVSSIVGVVGLIAAVSATVL